MDVTDGVANFMQQGISQLPIVGQFMGPIFAAASAPGANECVKLEDYRTPWKPELVMLAVLLILFFVLVIVTLIQYLHGKKVL